MARRQSSEGVDRGEYIGLVERPATWGSRGRLRSGGKTNEVTEERRTAQLGVEHKYERMWCEQKEGKRKKKKTESGRLKKKGRVGG